MFFVYFGMAVYFFYSIEQMDSFHLGLLNFVDYRQNFRNLMFIVGNFVVVKKNDYAGLYDEA